MISASVSTARLTAVPIAPDELSTCSSAGDNRSSKTTAPSAARIMSSRATPVISDTASLMRVMAGCDLQPNACRRKRSLNVHACALLLAIAWLPRVRLRVRGNRDGEHAEEASDKFVG